MGLALLLGAAPLFGAAGSATLRVTGAWVRPTPPGAPTAAVYGVVENTGAEEDRLIAVETDAAEAAELHSMTMDGGMMVMRLVEGGLAVPAHGTLAFAPGGYHIMLIRPNRHIMPGDTVNVTLVFEQAGRIALSIPARPPEAAPGAGEAGHGHDAPPGAPHMRPGGKAHAMPQGPGATQHPPGGDHRKH